MKRPPRPQSWLLLLGGVVLVLLIDQATKLIIRRNLALHQFVPLVGTWFGLRRVGTGPLPILGSEQLGVAAGMAACLALLRLVWRGAWGQPGTIVAAALVLGGVISSFIDVYLLRTGTNFLYVRVGEAQFDTNLAVILIVAAGISLMVAALRGNLPRDSLGPS
jgi:lipoprotein signal peptidase